MIAGPDLQVLPDLASRLDPRWSALLIIDMQRDFLDLDGAAARAGRDVEPGRAVVPALRSLLHTARHTGVLTCHIGLWTLPGGRSDSGPWLAQRRRATFSSAQMCVAGTRGADFIDEFAPLPGEPVVHKHRYSAFTGTDFDELLRAHHVRTCVVTGVSTNVCVESTLRDAFERDYYVVVPRDATASWSQRLADATLENVTHRFGAVATVADIVACWTPEARS